MTLLEQPRPPVPDVRPAGTRRFLIGPALYPGYLRVLRTVAAIGLPVVGALVATTRVLAGDPLGTVLLATAGALMAAAVQIGFWVTLGFALAERGGVTTAAAAPRAPQPVGLRETIVAVLLQAVLVTLVLWPWTFETSPGAPAVPVIAATAAPWLALVAAALVAGAVLSVLAYRVGRWTVPLAAATTLADAVVGLTVVWLLAADRLFAPAFLAALGDTLGDAAPVVSSLLTGVIGWAVAVGCVVDVVVTWLRALRR